MIVGLTGGIGSGKTTVLSLFQKKKGVVVYVADDRAKELMHTSDDIKESLIKAFGNEAYKEGKLNRDYLSKIVFQNPKKLNEINAIVHPAVKKDFYNFAQNNRSKIIIYESAILFEANSSDKCDIVINVSAPLKERISRVKKRDNVEEEAVLKRINNQLSDAHRNLQSNYVIFNFEPYKTKVQVNKIYNILTKKGSFI